MAQAVDGADAHPRKVFPATRFTSCRHELLPQLLRGALVVGAQHQLPGLGISQQQDVHRPERDGQGLAGAGTGHPQGRAVHMGYEFKLARVKPGITARQFGGDDVRGR